VNLIATTLVLAMLPAASVLAQPDSDLPPSSPNDLGPAPTPHQPKTEFFPLPMYATTPNEGSTYGVMPVFLNVDATDTVRAIFAPSLSWNSAAGLNGTVRYFAYPSPVRSWRLVSAISTHVNRTLLAQYDDLPLGPGFFSVEAQLLVRRNLFYRFYGLGPDTPPSNVSSYTRTTALLGTRVGRNLPAHFNLGMRGAIRGDEPERNPIFGLPATQDMFPGTPGLDGAALVTVELSLRFDTRDEGDYSRVGVASEVRGGVDQGLSNSDRFLHVAWHTRGVIQETRFLQGAGRLYWVDQLGGTNVPFYYQSSLGGEVLFRGFPEDRFVDRGAWELELEQRIRFLQTHFFHVTADWRVDPFVAVGQVYHRPDDMFGHVRVGGGLGLRAWVHPNVLGRVDVAYAGEGLTAYVVLGYPY
jgi:hypothetical protein